MLDEILKEKNISIYQCSKLSGIPYTTLSEMLRGKTNLYKCSAETIYKLSHALNMTMEEILMYGDNSQDKEIYKSNLCHEVKSIGELEFIIKYLKNDEVNKLWKLKRYFECFYLLGMIDYLSNKNDLPLCKNYNNIRNHKLEETVYPRDVLFLKELDSKGTNLEEIKSNAIPEFMRFNIVEYNIEDVY